jgi:hypothetical protein
MGVAGSRAARVFGLAAIGCAAVLTWSVASAQAVAWKPLNTAVTGGSINTRLEYGPQTIICDSEFKGTTAMAASATMQLTSWTFKNCTNTAYSAYAKATVGKTSLALTATKASGGGDGVAQFEIPNEAVVTFGLENIFGISICVYTATGPQSLTGAGFTNKSDQLQWATPTTSANWKWTGGFGSAATCGPAEEKAKFGGQWGVTPNNLEIE